MPLFLKSDHYRVGDLVVVTEPMRYTHPSNVRMRLFVGTLEARTTDWGAPTLHLNVVNTASWACMWPNGEFCSYENVSHNKIKSTRVHIDYSSRIYQNAYIEGHVCGTLNLGDHYEVSEYLRQCHHHLFDKHREEMRDIFYRRADLWTEFY